MAGVSMDGANLCFNFGLGGVVVSLDGVPLVVVWPWKCMVLHGRPLKLGCRK